MLLGGSVPLDAVLAALAKERPVFHSEADFQHAFAWVVRTHDPALRVRLETRPAPGLRLDTLVVGVDGALRSAVELKYLTRSWDGEFGGERFQLKDQGAQDVRAYEVVKDITRVESFVAATPGTNGAVVCVGNDPSYWTAPRHGRETNAHAFRIHEGTVLSGTRSWGPRTGPGSSKGRERPLTLARTYRMAWRPYSDLPGTRGMFRSLVVEVAGVGARPATTQ